MQRQPETAKMYSASLFSAARWLDASPNIICLADTLDLDQSCVLYLYFPLGFEGLCFEPANILENMRSVKSRHLRVFSSKEKAVEHLSARPEQSLCDIEIILADLNKRYIIPSSIIYECYGAPREIVKLVIQTQLESLLPYVKGCLYYKTDLYHTELATARKILLEIDEARNSTLSKTQAFIQIKNAELRRILNAILLADQRQNTIQTARLISHAFEACRPVKKSELAREQNSRTEKIKKLFVK